MGSVLIGITQSLISLIVFVAGIFVVFFLSLVFFGRKRGPTLVLRKFSVARNDENVIEIAGRVQGLLSWLMTILKLDTETSLLVTKDRIHFKTSSLFGQVHQVAPLTSVSSSHCGFSKPIQFFIIGVIIAIAGLVTGLMQQSGVLIVVGLIIGVCFFLAYSLLKKMTFIIETHGSSVMGLTFKRSIIENVDVDIDKVLNAIEILNEKVIESQLKTT